MIIILCTLYDRSNLGPVAKFDIASPAPYFLIFGLTRESGVETP